jgi:site-specific DNA recombinase
MLDIEVAVAKKQSNDISRKTKMGMLEKAEQGLYPSVAPIGYKNNRLTHLIEGDEDEAKALFIRKVFTLMASGSYSLAAIGKILNQEGFRGRKGYRVGKSAIEKILKNPIYYGAFRWQERLRDGSHPPLISKDLFDKACAALHGNARPYTNRRGFAFNNLLTCGDCGCKVLGEEKKEKVCLLPLHFFKRKAQRLGLCSRKRDRSSFRAGRESRHFRRGNRRVVAGRLE